MERTEQQLIEANIRFHNYLTGREWKHIGHTDYGSERYYIVTNTSYGRDLICYDKPHGFHSLWQVLQKIEDDELINKLIAKLPASHNTLVELYDELYVKVDQRKDPIDLFWAADAFFIELNKHLKNEESI